MIYYDNAATTRPNEKAVARAGIYLTERYYNPSALYGGGFAVSGDLKKAREYLLSRVADPVSYELTFTSCGTEADNQAVFCCAKRGNAVTTAGEHAAIYASMTELNNRGVRPRFAKLNADGSADVDDLLRQVDDKTAFVSVIHVNNETGAINPIADIAKKVKAKNPRVVFHTDGVQSFGKLPYRIGKDVDLYSLSAHKIGGLKGVGALICKKKLRLSPYLYGGGQEGGLRSGTENVFGIKTLEFAALEKYGGRREKYERMQELRRRFFERLDGSLFVKISSDSSSPYILSLVARGLRGEILLHRVNDRGLLIGTGSACSSNAKKRYSRVILACGVSERDADGVIRLSFSDETTEEELGEAAKILNEEARSLSEDMQ